MEIAFIGYQSLHTWNCLHCTSKCKYVIMLKSFQVALQATGLMELLSSVYIIKITNCKKYILETLLTYYTQRTSINSSLLSDDDNDMVWYVSDKIGYNHPAIAICLILHNIRWKKTLFYSGSTVHRWWDHLSSTTNIVKSMPIAAFYVQNLYSIECYQVVWI